MDIVINADDLGLHPAVQRAVETLGRRGVLTSASLLANGRFVEDGARVDCIELGVHLNILRGRPLLPMAEVGTLVDAGGRLPGSYVTLWRRQRLGRLNLEQVEAEWNAQVERVLDLGARPTHIDSEKHTHCWPSLMPIACRVARRYNIAWVRRTRERVSVLRWDAGGVRTRLLNFWARRHKKCAGVRWPDAVWGVADQAHRLEASRLDRYLQTLPDNALVEIVCHPGDPRPDDPPLDEEYGPMRVQSMWRAEFESLRDGSWIELLRDRRARLCGYGEASDAYSPPS